MPYRTAYTKNSTSVTLVVISQQIMSVRLLFTITIVLLVELAMVLSKDNCLVSSLSHPSNSGYFSYPVDLFSANFRNGDNIDA